MKKKSVRISSFILTIAIILTMIPMAGAVAFAEGEDQIPDKVYVPAAASDVTAENVADYVISAPATYQWTINRNTLGYNLNQNSRYLTIGNDGLSLETRAPYPTSATYINNKSDMYQMYGLTTVVFKTWYYCLTSNFDTITVDESNSIPAFGYLYDASGKLVTSSNNLDGSKVYIVSGNKKCLFVDSTHNLQKEGELSYYKPTENTITVHAPIYNGESQAILDFDSEYITVSAISGDAVVNGNEVVATNAGAYTITVKPVEGNYWPDWSAKEYQVEVEIALRPAKIAVSPLGEAFYRGKVADAVITSEDILEADVESINPQLVIYGPDGNEIQTGTGIEFFSGEITYTVTYNAIANYSITADDYINDIQFNEQTAFEGEKLDGVTLAGNDLGITIAAVELIYINDKILYDDEKQPVLDAAGELGVILNNRAYVDPVAFEITLCLVDGTKLTKVENAHVWEKPLDVNIPFEWDANKEYVVAHWNGASLDDLIPAGKVEKSDKKYLHITASEFSPYVVLTINDYFDVSVENQNNTFTVNDSEPHDKALAGEDYIFTVSPSRGYRIKNVSDLNGGTVEYVSERTYKLINVETAASLYIETEQTEANSGKLYSPVQTSFVNSENIGNYVVSAPATALWTISGKFFSGYNLRQNNRYLLIDNGVIGIQRNPPIVTQATYITKTNNLFRMYGYDLITGRYDGLTSAFGVSKVDAETDIPSFGYLFDESGRIVTSSDEFDGMKVFIVSNADAPKYLTHNGNNVTSSDIIGYYELIDNVVFTYDRTYTGQAQEIYRANEKLVVSVSGSSATVSGSSVFATNAGTYEITIKPADGYYWDDWSTTEITEYITIERKAASVDLVLPTNTMTYLDPVPAAVLTYSGIIEADIEALNASYSATCLDAETRNMVELTIGEPLTYFNNKGQYSITYKTFANPTAVAANNYFIRYKMSYVNVDPIKLPVATYTTYAISYNGEEQLVCEYNENLDIVSLAGNLDYFDGKVYVINAGNHQIKFAPMLGYAWADGTYIETSVALTVEKAVAHVGIVNPSEAIIYREAVPAASITYSGFYNDDYELAEAHIVIKDEDGNLVNVGDVVDSMTLAYSVEFNPLPNYEILNDEKLLNAEVNQDVIKETTKVGVTVSGDNLEMTTAAVKLVYVAPENMNAELKAAAEEGAKELLNVDGENKQYIKQEVVDIALCIVHDGGRLERINGAEISGEALEVYIPFEWAEDQEYAVAHWNGDVIRQPIPASKIKLQNGSGSEEKYLKFLGTEFSPYVILTINQYYDVRVDNQNATFTVSDAEPHGKALADSDYQFNVWAQSEYRIKSVTDLNGHVVEKTNESTYLLKNVSSDAILRIETEKVESRTETVYIGGGSSSPKSYNISVAADNGTYKLEKSKYEAGKQVVVSYSAKDGYEYKGCAVCTSKTLAPVPYTDEDGKLSFVMPGEAVSIILYFVETEKENDDILANFTDLDLNSWYIDAVRYCVENGFADGTSATTFEPGKTLTKAEALAMIWKMAGRLYPDYAMKFTDIDANAWYIPALRWGAAEKLVAEGGAFAPASAAQRQVVAIMLYNYAKSKGAGFEGDWVYRLSAPDANKIADWSYKAMAYLNMQGIMTGDSEGYIHPERTMTRAEMCTLIYKFKMNEPEYKEKLQQPEPVLVLDAEADFAKFLDLDPKAWYADPIRYCIENKIAKGVDETHFFPARELSRSEVIMMLWNMEGQPVVNYYMQVPDVTGEEWYAEALRWAVSEKIVSDKVAFNAANLAQRQEVATMFYRYIQSKGGGFTGLWMFNMDVADKDRIGDWALEPCMYMYMHNLMTGDGVNFNPGRYMSRAEMCTLVYRYKSME